jgi:hypothetical protein
MRPVGVAGLGVEGLRPRALLRVWLPRAFVLADLQRARRQAGADVAGLPVEVYGSAVGGSAEAYERVLRVAQHGEGDRGLVGGAILGGDGHIAAEGVVRVKVVGAAAGGAGLAFIVIGHTSTSRHKSISS